VPPLALDNQEMNDFYRNGACAHLGLMQGDACSSMAGVISTLHVTKVQRYATSGSMCLRCGAM
jgi:hypothetical protein